MTVTELLEILLKCEGYNAEVLVDWDIKNDATILYYLPDPEDADNKKLLARL